MDLFNPEKSWINRNNYSYKTFNDEEIKILVDKVNSNAGGILKNNTYVSINSILYKCRYDVVIINNRPYMLIKELGKGAFGKVYKGYDMISKILVAVKSQPIEYSDLIVKQATVTRKNGIGLVNPEANAGPTFLADKRGYFVLPLADLGYDKWVKNMLFQRNYKLVTESLIKICDDLINLHCRGYVHMDLKLDNVLVINNIAQLSDFGKAEETGSNIPSVMGYDYQQYPQCAPEYFYSYSGSQNYKVNPNFDYFSFGALIRAVASICLDPNYKNELINISSYIHKMKPGTRLSLISVRAYLKALLKN